MQERHIDVTQPPPTGAAAARGYAPPQASMMTVRGEIKIIIPFSKGMMATIEVTR
jgi:hypothetical protein